MITECDWRTILKDCQIYSRMRCLLAVYAMTPKETTVRKLLPYEQEVASKDIADLMGISRPSVHVLLDALQKEGLIYKEHYGRVVLTPPGKKRAAYLRKHISFLTDTIAKRLGTTMIESVVLAFQCVDMMSAERVTEIENVGQLYIEEKEVISC